MRSPGYVTTLASEVPASDDFLVGDELRVLSKLQVEKRRADWRHGRWTAKRALDLAWRRDRASKPPRWLVRAAEDGAPEAFFANGRAAPLRLSLSHGGGLAMAAVARLDGPELGCDVERVEPRSDELIRQFFTEDERARIAGVPPEDRALAACLIWSAKESALKALRTGLRADTRSVSVSVEVRSDAETWLPLEVRLVASGRALRGYWRTRSGPDARWVLTLIGASRRGLPRDLAAEIL